MSVSRALSGQPGVSESLRKEILKKAQELNYSKIKKNTNINILILHERPFIHDASTFSLRVQSLENTLQKYNIEYDIEFVDKKKQDNLILPNKLSKGITFDGIIFIGRFTHRYAEFINTKVENIVFYTGYSPAYNYDSVWFNFNNAGYKECEYLIKNGHKNIGYLGNKSIFRNKEMLLGITAALEDYSLHTNLDFFIDMKNDYKTLLLKLLSEKDRPTAIICELEFASLELIKICYENNILVPDDISIMTTGNTEISRLSTPSLTSLDLNIEYSCEVAVQLLLKKINYPDKPTENIAIYTTLIERDSVKNILADTSDNILNGGINSKL